MLDGYEIEIVVEYRRNGGNSMFNIREMKAEDKAVIMPMVITFIIVRQLNTMWTQRCWSVHLMRPQTRRCHISAVW